jgi:hypothetical protein
MINKPYENISESITKIMIQAAQKAVVEHVYGMFEAFAQIVEELEEENTHETTQTESK